MKMVLSNYLVKMSNTYRSPPKRITLLREVITTNNIAKTANISNVIFSKAALRKFQVS